MARITVEDCLEKVDNRFELVLAAAKRARQLERGAQPLVEWENDKPTVVALREIAAGLVTPEMLEKEVESAADLPGFQEAAAAFAELPSAGTGAAAEEEGPPAGEQPAAGDSGAEGAAGGEPEGA